MSLIKTKEVLMKKIFVWILAVLFGFSVYIPYVAHARGGGQSAANDGGAGRVEGIDRGKSSADIKKHEGEKKGEIKGKKKGKLKGKKKGEANRATPATPAKRAIPTPGSPGATKAVPATPAEPAKK
jgi:hypothetical protein